MLDVTMYSSTLHRTPVRDKGAILQGLTCHLLKKMRDIFASFHKQGSFPESSDFFKITFSMGASSAWRVCRNMGFN